MLKVIKAILLIGSLIFIYHFTMTPTANLGIGTSATGGVNLDPFKIMDDYHQANARYFIINEFGNVALFMPFGFFLPMTFKKIRAFMLVVFIGCLLSICIELAQLKMPTRWTDIDDVILNTTGAALGCIVFKILHLFYKILEFIWRPRKPKRQYKHMAK
ncbi:VanZ family protein [Pullulanibacillus sp. KACC 23026]|uniref:VanZ family protein n=1 Tax=Pullulanibacillus sp. KACC 23026 TaxID=3028315 RepID=UPI0023B1BCEF|nr:VanZ family protein [Pullulanibacillus sp. KACC 23026]WEG13288.1 VanZ family protein [Pullulanibacillus sp. KACC 23026]